MANDLHTDRFRAEGFGALATAYDATRPSYPPELIEWLSLRGTGSAVDVGCGTGRVAKLLTAAGWSVTGVEPDERMADIARTHCVQVLCAPFERCNLPHGQYDLVCSGTAWHWIDPAVGYDMAAALLRPGGRFAVFRNTYVYDGDLAGVFDAALQRHAPDLQYNFVALGTTSLAHIEPEVEQRMERSGHFTKVMRHSFAHERVTNLRDWITELQTYSQISTLDRVTQERLLDELVREVTATVGESLRIRHQTPYVEATRC